MRSIWLVLGLIFPLLSSCSIELDFASFVKYDNISFPTFTGFSPPANSIKKIYRHRSGDKMFVFVGSKNYLYKIGFHPHNIDNMFSLEGSASMESMHCETTGRDSYVTHILDSSDDNLNLLYVCGSPRGTCQLFDTLNMRFCSPPSFSPECNATDHMVDTNLTHKSVILPRWKGGRYLYYLGYEYDDSRQPSLSPPLLSIRKEGRLEEKLEQIVLPNHSIHQYRFRFLYAFKYKESIYFVTVQSRPNRESGDEKQTTWLVRVCGSDSLLHSWTQIQLQCEHKGKKYRVANVAHMAAMIHKLDYWGWARMMPDDLHVAFHDEPSKSSVVCHYNMDTMSHNLDTASEQCHFAPRPSARLMEAMQSSANSPTSCTQIEQRFDNFECNPSASNRFRESQVPVSHQADLTIKNDKITSMFAVNFSKHDYGRHVIVGTENARIVHFIFQDFSWYSTSEWFYVSKRLPRLLGKEIVLDLVLEAGSVSLIGAGQSAIFAIPLDDCYIFKSCESCHKQFVMDGLECLWDNSRCQKKLWGTNTKTCKPEVYNFEPKQGAVEGGRRFADPGVTIVLSVIFLLGLLVIIFLGSFWFYISCTHRKMVKHDRSKMNELCNQLLGHFMQSFNNDEFFQELYKSKRFILPGKLSRTTLLVSGNFSAVYKAFYQSKAVAIKVPRLTSAEEQQEQMAEFVKEAEFMKDFDHSNVISLQGMTMLCSMPAIVTPFMENGKLLSYLHRNHSNITVKHFFHFGLQIAKGMQYLAERQLVHRDLAARNVLVDNNFVLKISGFHLPGRFRGNTAVPEGWMAPESIESGLYDTKSDVWSYGVVLWEILACGCQPWAGIENWGDILSFLKKGYRLQNPMPEGFPPESYQLAYECWNEVPDARPSFKDLIHRIELTLKLIPENDNPGYYRKRIEPAASAPALEP